MAEQTTVIFATDRFEKLYTPEEMAHFSCSKWMAKYIERKKTASKGSGQAYSTHLRAFAQYIYKRHDKADVDDFIGSLKKDKDPYDALAGFALFLQEERTGEFEIGANMQRNMVKTAKRFLRFSKVAVTNEDFREQVSLPRLEEQDKKAVGKKTVIRLLNAAGVQLKTLSMFSGVFGPRPIEACAVRNRDMDLMAEPGTVTFRAEFSKMRKARKRYMTKEIKRQIQVWNAQKYRPHRATVTQDDGRRKQVWVTPQPKPDDLVFAIWNPDGSNPRPRTLYKEMQQKFADLVDQVEPGWQDNGMRREISLKTFRDFVKTTISDLGLEQFSEFWIGHKKSVYWNKPEEEIIKTFLRIEKYLTYLDPDQLEAMSADSDSKIAVLQKENLEMKTNMEAMIQAEVEKAVKRAMELRERDMPRPGELPLSEIKPDALARKKIEKA